MKIMHTSFELGYELEDLVGCRSGGKSMNALSIKKQNDACLSAQEASHKIREVGQLRRAKMHVSVLDNKNVLTPALCELLETSLIMQTTSTKILAAYLLQRSPATIRAELQRICTILWNQDRL